MFSRILVPIDNSALAEQALPAAVSLALASGAALELLFVHVPIPHGGQSDDALNAMGRSSERLYVESIADEIRNGTGLQVHSRLASGPAADTICAHAAGSGADLIVMTTHGRIGVSRAWLGSVADGVVRRSSIPVLLVRPAAERRTSDVHIAGPSLKRVLVSLDGSLAAESIVASAANVVKSEEGHLILLQVVPPVPLITEDASLAYAVRPMIPDPDETDRLVQQAKQRLETLVWQLFEQGVANVETHVVVDEHPAQAVLAAARAYSVDVIAMTTTGRGASRLVVGSVADHVLRASPVPLLVYRPISHPTYHPSVSAPADPVVAVHP